MLEQAALVLALSCRTSARALETCLILIGTEDVDTPDARRVKSQLSCYSEEDLLDLRVKVFSLLRR